MNYQLTENQSYDTSELQKALAAAGIDASVSGHGKGSFTVHGDDPSIDAVVQAHLAIDWSAKRETEAQRKQIQGERDASLSAIVHDFGDGRVVQVRPQDIANLQLAINLNVDQEWVMADNAVAVLTPAEMQAALNGGVMQGKQIWQTYIDAVKVL